MFEALQCCIWVVFMTIDPLQYLFGSCSICNPILKSNIFKSDVLSIKYWPVYICSNKNCGWNYKNIKMLLNYRKNYSYIDPNLSRPGYGEQIKYINAILRKIEIYDNVISESEAFALWTRYRSRRKSKPAKKKCKECKKIHVVELGTIEQLEL